MVKASFVLPMFLLVAGAASAQSAAPDRAELELSLERAMQIAASSPQSTTVQRGEQLVRFAKSGYVLARADLLPFLDGSVTVQNQTVSLRALGLRFQVTPSFTFPESVGPFSTFDARVHLTQNILSLTAIRSLQAAGKDVRVAEAQDASLRGQQAARVARLYAAVLRKEVELQTAKADIQLAEALRDLAFHKRSVGEGTDIEAARTSLAVMRHQQRLLAAETQLRQTQLDLINALNLGWDTRLKLTGELGMASADIPTVAEAVAAALQSRPDLKGQEERTASAKLRNSAAKLERMPSLVGYGDYGSLSRVPTHIVGASLKIPLFDGGRMEADRAQTLSLMRQEEIREKDLRNGVELEIRKLLDSLASKRQQVDVAKQAVAFASDVLARARRRYDAGVTNSVEVIDAQTQLELAEDEQSAALFDHTSARIDLAEAMGSILKFKL